MILLPVLLVGILIFEGCVNQTAPSVSPIAKLPSTNLATLPTAAKVIELKLSHYSPTATMYHKDIYVPWAQDLEARSNGLLKITIYPTETLGKVQDQYNLVLSRQADIAAIDLGTMPGVFPLSEGIALPLLFNSVEAANATWWKLTDKYLANTEFKKVHVIMQHCSPFMHVATSNKPIKTLADLTGVKIACPTDTSVNAFTKLGATVAFIPMPDIYTALERKLVDGYTGPWEVALAFKFFEVTKYQTSVSLNVSAIDLVMNLDTWNSLPPDIQQLLNETGGLQGSELAGRKFDESENQFESALRDIDKQKGNPDIYYLPETEKTKWRDMVTPLYEEWIKKTEAKGLPARAYFNDLQQMAAKYNE